MVPRYSGLKSILSLLFYASEPSIVDKEISAFLASFVDPDFKLCAFSNRKSLIFSSFKLLLGLGNTLTLLAAPLFKDKEQWRL